jgi:Ca-activated chloride channel family protein
MFHIAWPWMALLLPLPWLHYRMRRAAEPGGSSIFVPFAASLTAPKADTVSPIRSGRWIVLAIWLLLVGAATRPQWLGDPMPTPTSGRQLLLAIDVSGSMATEDMTNGLNRLQVVQQVAGRFIDRRGGDQVGLILFGSQPYLQAPLTSDLSTVHRFLNEALVGVAGPQTALGDAIGLAIKRLRDSGVDGKGHGAASQTILVLLTDGENDAGVMQPLQAAQLAKQEHLRIYTIGVGAPPDSGIFGSGNSDLDEDTLKSIASATGGRYFRATDESALEAIYAQINELEPAPGRQQWLRPEDEWFSWPLGVALLLSVPMALRFRRAWN